MTDTSTLPRLGAAGTLTVATPDLTGNSADWPAAFTVTMPPGAGRPGAEIRTFALARASFDFAGGREISLTVPKTCRVAR